MFAGALIGVLVGLMLHKKRPEIYAGFGQSPVNRPRTSSQKSSRLHIQIFGAEVVGTGLGINPPTRETEKLAQIPNIANSDTDKQLSVIIGLRHNF